METPKKESFRWIPKLTLCTFPMSTSKIFRSRKQIMFPPPHFQCEVYAGIIIVEILKESEDFTLRPTPDTQNIVDIP